MYAQFPLGQAGLRVQKTLFVQSAVEKRFLWNDIKKFRKEFPRFQYHGYKTEETEFAYKITYDFEIELSSLPTWTFPQDGNDGKIWEKDSLFRKRRFFSGYGRAGKLLEDYLLTRGDCGSRCVK